MRRPALLLAALLSALAARGDSVEPVIRDFFTAYAGGDVAAASARWDGQLPDTIARTMRVRCMRPGALRIVSLEISDDAAVARIEAEVTSWSTVDTPHERMEKELRTVRLRNIGGSWKIESWDRAPSARDAASAIALADRAVLEINRGEHDRARQAIDLAKEIADESGDPLAISTALAAESAYIRLPAHRDIAASASVAEEALRHAEAAGDADAIARALLRLGRASRAHTATTRALFRRALALEDAIVDLSLLPRVCAQLAEDASTVGNYREEMRFGLLAARYAKLADDPAGQLAAETNMAGAYLGQADLELARFHFERVRTMARALGFVAAEGSALHLLSRIEGRLGFDEDIVAAHREEALAIALRMCNHIAVAELLQDRALAHVAREQFDAASLDLMHSFREADAGAPYTGPQLDGGMQVFAHLLWRQGKVEEALRVAERYDTNVEMQALAASALIRLGRPREALGGLEQTIEMCENARGAVVGNERQQALFLGRYAVAYMSLIDVHLAAGEPEQAFRVAQRMKARVLRDTLAAGPIDAERDGDAEQRANREIAQLNTALIAAREPERIRAIREELARVRVELADFAGRDDALRREHRALSTAAIDLAPVVDRAVVIDYVIGQEKTAIFVIKRGPDGAPRVSAHALKIEPHKLAARVRELRAALEQRNLQYGALSESMYALLVAPIEHEIAGAPLVGIVPAGPLWNVPFHALRDANGRYLAEKTSVFYAPSVVVLAETLRREPPADARRQPTLLAFANPNIRATTAAELRTFHERADLGAIPEAEEEVRSLARLYGPQRSRVYIGDEARESVLKREAGGYDVLHVASHGLLDDSAPMFSALVLSKAPNDESEDGLLEAREISALRPGTRIAVLSACETGRGQISSGEGVIGLSWALLAAGCPTAVVSQWKAVSVPTATLMVEFHRNLLRGTDAAASLQKAQLALMHDERFSHPFYWAPFVIVGAP